MQASAGSADYGASTVEEASTLNRAVGGEAAETWTTVVDVQHVGSRQSGGDGEIGCGLPFPPLADPVRVSCCVMEAVPSGGFLAAWLTR